MIKVKTFTFNAFSENTYILFDEKTKEAVLIDPGAFTSQERQELQNYVRIEGLKITAIWLTHSHIDHVLGLDWAINEFGIPYLQSAMDVETLRFLPLYAATYGVPNFALPTKEPQLIKEGSLVMIGNHEFSVFETPGHAPGHIALYHPDLGVIAGDVLFAGSIGRTDLPGGSFPELEKSIREKLYVLPNETRVYPGHGPITTIGQEKRHNPYVRG
jgi:glyoxylase-like metal-dependent hydrolase (beta-lactamase superfamily II)